MLVSAAIAISEAHSRRSHIQTSAHVDESHVVQATRVTVAKDGAHKAVQKALHGFREFQEVQGHGFAALQSMSLNTENLHTQASRTRRDELRHSQWSGLDFACKLDKCSLSCVEQFGVF